MWRMTENHDEEAITFRAKLDDLSSELSAHPGRRAHARWMSLRYTMDLHARNLSELIAVVHRAETDVQTAMELVQNGHAPTVRDEFNAQLDQRLHNAVASALTLIDHMRRVVAGYEGSEFSSEFSRRNDAIKLDPRAEFIRGLRNYVTHYSGAVPYSHSVSFGQESFQARVLINAQALLHWSGWSANARALLANPGEGVDLGELVRWYRDETLSLGAWLFAQFDGLHGGEVESANRLVDDFNRYLTGETSDP